MNNIKPDSEYHIANIVNNRFQTTGKGYELLIHPNGYKAYYLDSLLHRENAPAIICKDGLQEWLIHHKYHRINGPAVIWQNGEKSYRINDKKYVENKYWEMIFSTEKYVKELVKYCPICETYFESREEAAVHLDREIEAEKFTLELQNNSIINKRIELIIKGF